MSSFLTGKDLAADRKVITRTNSEWVTKGRTPREDAWKWQVRKERSSISRLVLLQECLENGEQEDGAQKRKDHQKCNTANAPVTGNGRFP